MLNSITFANGEQKLIEFCDIRSRTVCDPVENFKVKAIENISDGDWKTAAVKGPRQLLKDEEMVVKEIFVNFYGLYLSGYNPRGQYISVKPNQIVLVDSELGDFITKRR